MTKKIRLTQRDLELLQWINAYGFVTAGVLAYYWKRSRSVVYRRLHKLVSKGYLVHEYVFHGMPGVYRLTRHGAFASGSELPALRTINRATYHHDLVVLALSLILCEQHQAQFVTERTYRHQQGLQGVGQLGHVCDGLLLCGAERFAIEVELSRKGRRRRERILQSYQKNFDIQAVWYFYGASEVKRQLDPYTQSMSFLNVFALSDYRTVLKKISSFEPIYVG